MPPTGVVQLPTCLHCGESVSPEPQKSALVCSAGHAFVDAGGGTGRFLAAVLDALTDLPNPPVGLTLDLSKPAVQRAARAHPRAAAVRCDVKDDWPVRAGVAGLVLDVLAPATWSRPGVRCVLTGTLCW